MPKPSKIAIIGVGLLGGSLALALKKQKGVRMIGWNHRASSRKKAAKIIKVAPSFEKAVTGADTIVLCGHSSSILPELKQLGPLIGKDTLVLDVSSVKGVLVREAARISGAAAHFVPCHPMAGKEKSGPLHADAKLYKGKIVFITPLPKTRWKLVGKAAVFWKKTGAIPVFAGPSSHDKAVALTSHLPHLLSSAMIELFGRYDGKSPLYKKAVGSGFRDFTRIAGGNPVMWRDIVEMNAPGIKSFLSQYRRKLAELEKNLKRGRGRYWLSFFEKARALREKL
jgi:prephenate dehydrogenase